MGGRRVGQGRTPALSAPSAGDAAARRDQRATRQYWQAPATAGAVSALQRAAVAALLLTA
ncbi:hypothetical protein IV454_09060 [Massilia antarctica]|uniref:Uncharacterized protein n=1 Tax=Massilia antarctica TaxID=2765360 RepID=A0AA48WFR5_9BURK|nr:hypothetical protein [Massilia antarctica]QPI51626.1 hypothetical protein IV454_09060 [Massilia antarctica]